MSPNEDDRSRFRASLSKFAFKSPGPSPRVHHVHDLSPLPDYLAPGLDVVFCGINPGYMSAQKGHHFANPTNHFWKCLHQSGFTPTLLPPSRGYSLPQTCNIGLTNLVDRPSAEASDLSPSERLSAVPVLLAKLVRYRPKFLCLVGVSNWDVVRKVLLQMSAEPPGPTLASTKTVGLQPFKICYPPVPDSDNDSSSTINETLLFVVPSTSGRVVHYQLPDKVQLFSELKKLLDQPPSESDTSEMKRITVSNDSRL